MALVDLKRKKTKKEVTEGPSSYEERPYSLRFSLERQELDALGLTPSAFSNMEPITATVVIDPIAIRNIKSKTSDNWSENSNQSVEFQILKIDLGKMTPKKSSSFEKFNDQQKKGAGE